MTELEIKGFTDGYMAKQAKEEDRGPHSVGNRLLGAALGSMAAAPIAPITATAGAFLGSTPRQKIIAALVGGAIPVVGGAGAGAIGGTKDSAQVVGRVSGLVPGALLGSMPGLAMHAIRGKGSKLSNALLLAGAIGGGVGGAYGGGKAADALHDVIYDAINK